MGFAERGYAALLSLLGLAALGCTTGGGEGRATQGRLSSALAGDPPAWVKQQDLAPSDGEIEDKFGWSVGLTTNHAIVGAYGESNLRGAAYVMGSDGATWTQLQKLQANDGAAFDYFGYAVAVSGDAAVIGAYGDEGERGAAYVFRRSGDTWSQEQKLVASDGAAEELFGLSVAISGTTVLIGAARKAYVFTHNGATWTQQQILLDPDGFSSRLGNAVAIEGDTAVVGAFLDGTLALRNGAVCVFQRSGNVWSFSQKLLASDGIENDRFGTTLALSGNHLLIGAPGRDYFSGLTYAFARSGATWSEQQKITKPDPEQSSGFGDGIALSGDRALIGARSANQVHVFVRSGSSWAAQQLLEDDERYADFGKALALAGDVAVVGAPGNEVSLIVGSAYAFGFGKTTGDVCTSGGECGSGKCSDSRCCDALCDGPCDVCAESSGASEDGTCTLLPPGAPGSPVCPQYACSGAAPGCTACGTDSHCAGDKYCAPSGLCQPRKAQGDACDAGSGADCKSDGCRVCGAGLHCVDGVCCNQPCAGECEACLAQHTALGNDGVCGPIAADTDPEGECEPDPNGGPCAADGLCNGLGGCRSFAKPQTPCGETTCENLAEASTVSGWLCDGQGGCQPKAVSCENYLCSGSACAASCASNDDCSAAAYCLNARCIEAKPRGEECSVNRECSSGHCVDGVCCNTACAGQCEACAEEATPGTCTPVQDQPRGERPACATGSDQDPCAARHCDGVDGSECAGYAGSAVTCREGSCADDTATLAGACDGRGSCSRIKTASCAPFACADSRCGTGPCDRDAQCAAEFRCQDGDCVPQDASTCDDEGLVQRDPDGTSQDCEPYVCRGIACLTSCTASTDCVSGHVCNTVTSVCESAAAPAAPSDAGCGCRLSERRGSRSRAGLWLGAAAVLLWRLRRRAHRNAAVALAAGALSCSSHEASSEAPAGTARQALEGDVWVEQERLDASDRSINFGNAVSLSGTTALVATPWDDALGAEAGSAYVFEPIAGSWTERVKLLPSDGAADFRFGTAVAIAGDLALVGADGADSEQGAAYVFVRNGTDWTEEAKLVATDGEAADRFGTSVAIAGQTAVIGAPGDDEIRGAAYVFVRNAGNWSQQAKLVATDRDAAGWVGLAVAVSGETAAVGSNNENQNRGAAYVFTRNGTIWSPQQRVSAADLATGDNLGTSLALSGDTLVAGATGADPSGIWSGAAYVFTRSGTTWSEQKKLTASDGGPEHYFGESVAVAGNSVLVGAPGDSTERGAAYAFERDGASWTEQKLLPEERTPNLSFGWRVSVSGNLSLIGNRVGGGAYVFALGGPNGKACTSAAECGSAKCIDGRCCNSRCEGACNACSVLDGAVADGVCGVVAAGSPGSPACELQACNGESVDCEECSGDFDCPNDRYCTENRACRVRQPAGGPCDDCAEDSCRVCSAGLVCVDSVCCTSACDGPCEACSAARKGGGADGTCEPVAAATDPDDECPLDGGFPASCGADGFCDGEGACRVFAGSDVMCGATSCDQGVLTQPVCNGGGDCVAELVSCKGYTCAGTACRSECDDSQHCTSDAYCSNHECRPKQAAGEPCSADEACASGFCVDEVCCNAACTGQCEACAETGTEGTCTPVLGTPRGPRPACAGGTEEDPCAATRCDGGEVRTCAAYVGSERLCRPASCENGTATLEASCDGEGSCPEPSTERCAPFVCAGEACSDTCETDRDCEAAFRCEAGDCIARDATSCEPDGTAQRNPNGTTTECAPYICSRNACLERCTDSTECARGFVCDGETSRCEAGEGSVSGDAGCGCRAAGGQRSPLGGAAAVFAAFALLGRATCRTRRRCDSSRCPSASAWPRRA